MIKAIAIFAMFAVLIVFSGCAKCINEEFEYVEVTVLDVYHKPMWMQPVIAGKVMTYITHPAIWRVYVEYKEMSFTINGSNTYHKYKNKIGESVIGVLETKTYDDGTVHIDIVALE